MDLRKVKKLIELVEESGIAELEVTSGDESVRIAMSSTRGAAAEVIRAVAPVATPLPTAPVAAKQAARNIVAPMSGTFYRAPSPEADPYVAPGQAVAVGDVIGIIESMKMMHEIHANEEGVVLDLPVENGAPITTGDVLVSLS